MLPGPGGYKSFGLVWEEGKELPAGFSKKVVGFPRVANNCAICHVEAGGGNAQMELEFTTKREKTRILDVKPVHDTYGLAEARLIAPGHPERSVLLHRIAHRGAGHMPPLATSVVDRESVELLRAWITQLKP